jgi:hypothetical protein
MGFCLPALVSARPHISFVFEEVKGQPATIVKAIYSRKTEKSAVWAPACKAPLELVTCRF